MSPFVLPTSLSDSHENRPFSHTQPLAKRHEPRKFSRNAGLQDAAPIFGWETIIPVRSNTVLYRDFTGSPIAQYLSEWLVDTLGQLTTKMPKVVSANSDISLSENEQHEFYFRFSRDD
jgi:hypothetical protein